MPKFFSGKREVYLEVADRYERYIKLGVLSEGDKLPSVRAVAEDMGVNPNTVQKAYSRLEELGLVVTVPKKGVFVSVDTKKPQPDPHALNNVLALKASGVTEQELLQIISEVYSNDQN